MQYEYMLVRIVCMFRFFWVLFSHLTILLQESQLRAENCLKFISLLQEPCEDLKAAEPSAIPALVPRLLTTIRVIWNNSEHYKSRERLNGLLRRVSSEGKRRGRGRES